MANTDLRALQLLKTFDSITVHEKSLDSFLVQRFKNLGASFKVISEEEMRAEKKTLGPKSSRSPEEFLKGKKQLLLQPFEGQFFKTCPGSSQKTALTCCNYFILNWGSQCHFDCGYCYLQSYLSDPRVVLYTNISKAFEELDQHYQKFSHLPLRVGTGEVVDSLGLDPLSLMSRSFINYFREKPTWTLEFKTKSKEVDQFLDLPGSKNILVSWSINPQEIIAKEEKGTASLEERLQAAEKCLARGYGVAFHLDPMIAAPDWESLYTNLVDQLISRFQPKDIHTLSLGSLRFQREQKFIHLQRFGMNSFISQGEFFPSASGKLRYDQSLRNKMTETVVKKFKSHSPDWKIFLCMETPETWMASFGHSSPIKQDELKTLFRPLPAPQSKPQTQENVLVDPGTFSFEKDNSCRL